MVLQRQTVTPELLDLAQRLTQEKILQDFRLVGGTALALQLGHRTSIDIDLFTNQSFETQGIKEHFSNKYDSKAFAIAPNSVEFRISNIKISTIAHQYPWLEPPIKMDGLRMATLKDIAALKLHAINNAGNRQKDFVDMYFLLGKFSLEDIASGYHRKYPDLPVSIAKESVRTFERLDPETEIKTFDNTINWDKVRKRLEDAVLNPNKIYKANLQSLLPKKNRSDGHQHKPRL